MAAGMLTDERLVLQTAFPRLADIATMSALVAQHGVRGRTQRAGPSPSAGAITNTEAPYDIVRKMRASILVLGPLLARMREARVSLPWRMRHRHPPRRPPPQGSRADGRHHPPSTAAT